MNTRDAVDTIRGYYYQFDYCILSILEQNIDENKVYIECIEDVDVETANDKTAVQCKYYAGTVYNHSAISQAIRFMLQNFSQNKSDTLNYKIYGYYKSGQEKLPKKLEVEFVKKHFLTYTKKGVEYKEYEILNLDDKDIESFIEHLEIDVNAISFEEQEKKINEKLIEIFKCNFYEADTIYYNNALRIIKNMATSKNAKDRKISKKQFLQEINTKEVLFNQWYLNYKNLNKYCKNIKKEYFTYANISPYERFFLIECNEGISTIEIKDIVLKISEKWCNIKMRQPTPFCPYIFFYGLSDDKILSVKVMLQEDDFYFIDGYDFKNASFNLKSIIRKANYYNKIKVKLIDDLENVKKILESISGTREIYQFYINKPFYYDEKYKNIRVPIIETKNVLNII